MQVVHVNQQYKAPSIHHLDDLDDRGGDRAP